MIIDNLVETHCHILPALDDGAPDVQTSLEMIDRLKKQGARAIILTPHYYSDSISLNDFIAKRDRAFNELMQALPQDSPVLIPAAEVYISDYIFSNINLDALKIGNSDYVLIEHSFSCHFSESTYNRLRNLYCDYGIKPILAHVERYPSLMNDVDLIDEYIDMGCLIQANVDSFAGSGRSIRKKLFKYLESGRIHLLGSDCHNLSSRAPSYQAGVNEIVKRCGREAIELLVQNANILIK